MNSDLTNHPSPTSTELRKTTQYLMPAQLHEQPGEAADYNIYPVCALGANKIFNGYVSLTKWIIAQKVVVIDGYVGVFWDKIQAAIQECLAEEGLRANWINTSDFLKSSADVDVLVAPYLGTASSVWGTKCTLTLADLYQTEKLAAQQPDQKADINIIIGPAAALANWNAAILYIDLPKNELQFRMRAGSVNNLGAGERVEAFRMYKRFYL
jgi:hypothetical protein